jgi:hypothetical protein
VGAAEVRNTFATLIKPPLATVGFAACYACQQGRSIIGIAIRRQIFGTKHSDLRAHSPIEDESAIDVLLHKSEQMCHDVPLSGQRKSTFAAITLISITAQVGQVGWAVIPCAGRRLLWALRPNLSGLVR